MPTSQEPNQPRAEAVIDLTAIRYNVATLRAVAGSAEVMAAVKADGYGHGMVASARAARAGGASWIGVAVIEEAVALRAAGDTGRVFCWLAVPGEPLADAVAADVDLSASSTGMIAELESAAQAAGRPARVHLKADTGLSRSGAAPEDWTDVVAAAAKAQAAGHLEIAAVWSHLACSDTPDHPANAAQVEAFERALEIAERHGIRPPLRHLANSGGTLALPRTRFDLVRPGIAVFGLSPFGAERPSAALGLRPATRSCCSAPATTVSRPRTTGPRRRTRSTTRSSRGSARGCPGRTPARWPADGERGTRGRTGRRGGRRDRGRRRRGGGGRAAADRPASEPAGAAGGGAVRVGAW